MQPVRRLDGDPARDPDLDPELAGGPGHDARPPSVPAAPGGARPADTGEGAPAVLVDRGGGVGHDPLRGDDRRYAADHDAGDGSDDAPALEGTDSRGWIVVGMVVLIAFLAGLVAAALGVLG